MNWNYKINVCLIQHIRNKESVFETGHNHKWLNERLYIIYMINVKCSAENALMKMKEFSRSWKSIHFERVIRPKKRHPNSANKTVENNMFLLRHIEYASFFGIYISSKHQNEMKCFIFRWVFFIIIVSPVQPIVSYMFWDRRKSKKYKYFTFKMAFCVQNMAHLVDFFDTIYYFLGIMGALTQVVSFSLNNRLLDNIVKHFSLNSLKRRYGGRPKVSTLDI